MALAEENLARARAARAAQLAELEDRRAGGEPPRGRQAGIEDCCRVRRAAAKVEKARSRAAAAARRAAGREKARKGPGPVRNITGPDSRLMPVRGGGFVQGYNAQNVASEDGLIIAAELTNDPVDYQWSRPMLGQAEQAAALIGASCPAAGPGKGSGIGLVLADAGYCSEANLTTSGPDRLIAVGKLCDLGKAARGSAAAGRERAGPATVAMAGRLTTADGLAAYHRRSHIAETPHGHIKQNMRLRQLSVRGKTKAAAEWAFAATVHNLFKAITSGHLTTQALAALPA